MSDKDDKPINQTRHPTSTGNAAERQMLDRLHDTNGIRKIVEYNADGTQTMCTTRAGFPEFVTAEPKNKSSDELSFDRGFVAVVGLGVNKKPSYLLVFNDAAKTVAAGARIKEPTYYHVEEKHAPQSDGFARPKPMVYADTLAYRSGALYVNGRKIKETALAPVAVLYKDDRLADTYTAGLVANGSVSTFTSAKRLKNYGDPTTVNYTIGLANPQSISFSTTGELKLEWVDDALTNYGIVKYSVTPSALTLTSEVSQAVEGITPVTLSATAFLSPYTPSHGWDIPTIIPRLYGIRNEVPGNPGGFYYGTLQWNHWTPDPTCYYVQDSVTGSIGGYTVDLAPVSTVIVGARKVEKSASIFGRYSYGTGTTHIKPENEPTAEAAFAAAFATGGLYNWYPQASYPFEYTVRDGVIEYIYKLEGSTTLNVTIDSVNVYTCSYSLNDTYTSGNYARLLATAVNYGGSYAGMWDVNVPGTDDWTYRRMAGVGGGQRWIGGDGVEDHIGYVPFSQQNNSGPNINCSWEKYLFKDAENDVFVRIYGEVHVTATNSSINRFRLEDVSIISASVTMWLEIRTPGWKVVKQLLNKPSCGADGPYNAVDINYCPNPDSPVESRVYVPVFVPTIDKVGNMVPPAEQGNTNWIAYETKKEFESRTESGKVFRLVMSWVGDLPIPPVLLKMFMGPTQPIPNITNPFYEFVTHKKPGTSESEPSNFRISYVYNQDVAWVPALFPGIKNNSVAKLMRI